MKTLKDLKIYLVGGLAALTLVALVACTGTTSQEMPEATVEPTTDQITISNTSTADADPVEDDSIVTIVDPTSDDLGSAGDDSVIDPVEATAEIIPAVFDDGPSKDPVGDDTADVAPQEAESTELTSAEIVAAQQEHLVSLYEKTVESVVFIYSRTTRGEGSGSGFVWDDDGHIVTNYHVIQNAGTITVRFFNGREYRADIVAQDPAADLAVIKLIDLDHELTPIAIGSSSELRPGDTAIALGNPFGQDFTMTTGIVSAIARTISSGFSSYSIPSVIQTDAAINPGNSGGPLLDLNGAVIGVNTQIVSETAQSSGVGFAVPVDLVKRVVPSLIETGEYVYPLMGISGNEVELTLRENVGLPAYLVGAYVTSVSPDGPADLAGIRGDSGTQFSGLNFDGDVIVSINSVRMESMDDLIGYLALNTSPGEEIIVGVFRDGVEIALPMTLGSRPTIT